MKSIIAWLAVAVLLSGCALGGKLNLVDGPGAPTKLDTAAGLIIKADTACQKNVRSVGFSQWVMDKSQASQPERIRTAVLVAALTAARVQGDDERVADLQWLLVSTYMPAARRILAARSDDYDGTDVWGIFKKLEVVLLEDTGTATALQAEVLLACPPS